MKAGKSVIIYTVKIICLAVFIFLIRPVYAEGKKAEKLIERKAVMKEVAGEVTWIGKKYIAVLYQQDSQNGEEEEILLPFDNKDIRLEHKRNLSEINKGDTVSVHYEEETRQYDSNREEVKRKAKVVSFIRAAVKKPESSVLQSQEGQ